MKRLLLSLFLLALLATACKKDGIPFSTLKGVWVEKSLRLDTIDFNKFPVKDNNGYPCFVLGSAGYAQVAPPGFYSQQHTLPFSYHFGGDSLRLHSMLSSTMNNYTSYYFKWGAGRKSFTIQRFYQRQELPAQLVFEKLQ